MIWSFEETFEIDCLAGQKTVVGLFSGPNFLLHLGNHHVQFPPYSFQQS